MTRVVDTKSWWVYASAKIELTLQIYAYIECVGKRAERCKKRRNKKAQLPKETSRVTLL